MPPQQPSPGAGGPRPPRRAGGRALLVASSIAGAILLAAGILVAVNVSGGRPYADLPTCRQLLGDLTEEIPGTGRPSVDGDRHSGDDVSGHYAGDTEAEPLSGVECSVEDPDRDGDPFAMGVHVYLYDHEDERGLADLHHQLDEETETYEDGSLEEDTEDLVILGWERSSLGDAGILSVHEQGLSGTHDPVTTAHGLFLTNNLSVSYSYRLDERDDEEEAMEFVRSFGQGLERQLRAEAEFV